MRGPPPPRPPLFLDQTGARGAEIKVFWDLAIYLRVCLDVDPPPPPPPSLSQGLDPPTDNIINNQQPSSNLSN